MSSTTTKKKKSKMSGKQMFENFKTFAFGAGGSVVIVGALMKLTHMELFGINGNVMLGIGLGTEAFIFLISAFDFEKVSDEAPVVSKVAPQLSFLEDHDGIQIENGVLEKESQKEITESAKTIAKNLHEIESFTNDLSKVLGSRTK